MDIEGRSVVASDQEERKWGETVYWVQVSI